MAYKIEWVVSPLQESPYVECFDFWHELEDWIAHMESTCDAFDLEYAKISEIK